MLECFNLKSGVWNPKNLEFPYLWIGNEAQLQVTGYYDLAAVLTHKGRSADSGHYVAWVKQESGKC
mgnify:CR=1 FL=1